VCQKGGLPGPPPLVVPLQNPSLPRRPIPWLYCPGWLRPEWFPGSGVLPGPATESHIVNRGTSSPTGTAAAERPGVHNTFWDSRLCSTTPAAVSSPFHIIIHNILARGPPKNWPFRNFEPIFFGEETHDIFNMLEGRKYRANVIYKPPTRVALLGDAGGLLRPHFSGSPEGTKIILRKKGHPPPTL